MNTKYNKYYGLGAAGITFPLVWLLSNRNKLLNATIASGLVGGATYLGKTIYDYGIKGKPYDPSLQLMPDSEDVYIGVSGAGEGGHHTKFAKRLRTMYGNKVAMFRWNDREALRKFLKEAHSKGKRIHTFGHSYGGATLMQELRDTKIPVISATTYDPVSWTDRVYKKPVNVQTWTNYIPDKYYDLTDTIANIGGKWGDNVPNSKRVSYSHGDITKISEDDYWNNQLRQIF